MSLNDDRGIAKSLINLATTYLKQGDIEQAEETFNSAIDYSQKADYIKGKSWILSGLAEIYFEKEQFRIALENRFDALAIDKNIGNKYGEIINLNQIGRIYLSQGRLNEAEQNINKAYDNSKKNIEMLKRLVDSSEEKMQANGFSTYYTEYLEQFIKGVEILKRKNSTVKNIHSILNQIEELHVKAKENLMVLNILTATKAEKSHENFKA